MGVGGRQEEASITIRERDFKTKKKKKSSLQIKRVII